MSELSDRIDQLEKELQSSALDYLSLDTQTADLLELLRRIYDAGSHHPGSPITQTGWWPEVAALFENKEER